MSQVVGFLVRQPSHFRRRSGTAVLVQNHDLPLRQAFVYDNTIYAAGTGIRFGNAAPQGDAVFGNLIFAGTATAGTISDLRDNVSDSLANAALYVSAPSTMLGEMDFYPLAGGRAQGTALDMAKVVGDSEYDRDFNGTDRGAFTFRGAYAGEGTNPGWQLRRKASARGCGHTIQATRLRLISMAGQIRLSTSLRSR